MTDTSRENIAVYFGGYVQSELPGSRNAFSTWIAGLGDVDQCFMNLWRGDYDVLPCRGTRVERILKYLKDRPANVNILGYSIGCHLAVKFAHEVSAINGSLSFGDFWLIAPDPKFIPNELDHTGPSAYAEAKAFWETDDPPGEIFSLQLCMLPTKLQSPVRIVYSGADTIAMWDDNVEVLKSKCNEQSEFFKWIEVRIGHTKNINQECVCTLDPDEARDDGWVHEQLFTKTQISSAAFQ